ncbi:thioesterase family protein [Thalassococcus sp. CAU 1522]|uniref:Thioesterase family protein n=1 Tax=Thalassococcus arenae TaxID=2851652 RepID=A0ABS6N626_9RHOB|nr:acyl-CoA thioesterase [Thalassococcus arenae]MBV2359248.1 thioesterase family protein [Thalassococcus arenae]
MYPFVRLIKDILIARRQPPVGLFDTHVSYHVCWPWDLDMWMELNNGRTLTLYDLGRLPLAQRAGLLNLLARQKWGLTMAGAVVRYRRRVRAFERIEMRSRLVGWDDRFMYLEQSMWKRNGDCASHIVYRSAVTDRNGIVATDRVLSALNLQEAPPALPDWIEAWLKAEDMRPWPPMQMDDAAAARAA